MSTHDDVTIMEDFEKVPKPCRHGCWQTTDLKCEMHEYRVLGDGLFTRVVDLRHRNGGLLYSKNLNGRFGIHCYSHSTSKEGEYSEITLIVKNGIVVDVILGEEPWGNSGYEKEPLWVEFIEDKILG